MGSRRLVIGALVATIGCDAPTVPAENPAYDPTLLTEGYVYHWPLGRAVRIYIDTAAGGSVLTGHVQAAGRAWKSVVYYRELNFAIVRSPEEADVIVHAEAAPYLVDFGTCGPPSTVGAGDTYLCANETFDRLARFPLLEGGGGNVRMDMSVDLQAGLSDSGLRALVAHELGHVFGIGGHSNVAADVMFSNPSATIPSDRDARTMRYILHQPVDLRL